MSAGQQVVRSVGRSAVAVAIVVTLLTACDTDESAGRPTGPGSPTAGVQTRAPSPAESPEPTSTPTADGSSTLVVEPQPAAMPELPLRYMYARGPGSEGVLVSAAGTTGTGRRASAYVATRTGAVFASGDQVYDLEDGGPAVAIGPVPERSVFLQADPTLRYVVWDLRRPDGIHARVLVYDAVGQRIVMDRVLPWADRQGPLRVTTFGATRLRLVHLPGWDFWTFATVSGDALATPGGQVVEPGSDQVVGPRVSRGVWSPGLRYRASEARGRRPWQVVDLTTGQDVTPPALLTRAQRAAHLTGWLGGSTFGVLTSSGTWRHQSLAASVCRVAGRCRVVWHLRLGAEDSGLQSSNEIG